MKKISLVASESTDRRIEASCEYPRMVGMWFVRNVYLEVVVDIVEEVGVVLLG
jgi:hypothetical protein